MHLEYYAHMVSCMIKNEPTFYIYSLEYFLKKIKHLKSCILIHLVC
jgi:hypothetical protein